MKTVSFAILFLATMTNKCRTTSEAFEIIEVRFGTSFGRCMGYCTQIVTFNAEKVSKTLTPRPNQNIEEKFCDMDYTEFANLKKQVDLVSFFSLEETIGCPDCADGGAEWIEIATMEGSKKVTYEYGKEPKEVKSFISDLRKYYDLLSECK